MGRPPTLVQDCLEAQAGLLARGIQVGQKIPRPMWDRIVAQLLQRADGTGASASQVRNFTATGRINSYWDVQGGHGPGNAGWVALQAPALPTSSSAPAATAVA